MKKKHDPVTIIILVAMAAAIATAGILLIREIRFSKAIRQENEELKQLWTQKAADEDSEIQEKTVATRADKESSITDETEEAEEAPYQVDFTALRKINPDICAWITLEGTGIDYPVLQGSDNLEYLNKNAYGDNAAYGSIFLDYRNSNDFTDGYSLIYGHHMIDGNMFGNLDLYENEEFFNSHKEGTLYTPDCEYSLKVCAYALTDCGDEFIFYPEGYDEESFMAHMEEISMYRDEIKGERLLALSTCSPGSSTRRCVLLLAMEPSSKFAKNN